MQSVRRARPGLQDMGLQLPDHLRGHKTAQGASTRSDWPVASGIIMPGSPASVSGYDELPIRDSLPDVCGGPQVLRDKERLCRLGGYSHLTRGHRMLLGGEPAPFCD